MIFSVSLGRDGVRSEQDERPASVLTATPGKKREEKQREEKKERGKKRKRRSVYDQGALIKTAGGWLKTPQSEHINNSHECLRREITKEGG